VDPGWNANFTAGLPQGVSLALSRRRFFLKRKQTINFNGKAIVFPLFQRLS